MTGRTALGSGLATLLAAASLVAATPSGADDTVVKHHVKYTVSAASPSYTDIYYLDQEPPIFSDYSHNPYQFVPNIKVDISPGHPWTYELDLAKPEQWALVTASTGLEPRTPGLHCDLTVDGKVVVSKDGPKGVLCSIRHW
ncbi:hypothetical protein [Mycobacterium sp.]|uniref:hypothetical protein n=1 Tax=Mycobacterium sp. TaxID=1785 RepID=UPI0025F838EA|nr:hypothetical protein [Mycobacterium sp.]